MACHIIAREAWALGNGATRATLPSGMRRTSAPVKNSGGRSASAGLPTSLREAAGPARSHS